MPSRQVSQASATPATPIGGSALLDLDALEKIARRATAGPWCVEQCGIKEDAPVVGIAYRDDDHDCKNPLSGWLPEYDGEGEEIECYREPIATEIHPCDGASAGANAHHIATFNPAMALALIAAIRTAHEAIRALLPEGWGDDDIMDHMPGVKLARAALRACVAQAEQGHCASEGTQDGASLGTESPQ